MERDPRIWGKDSNEFNPDRFLPEHNPYADDLPDMSSLFGEGTWHIILCVEFISSLLYDGICPGRHIAEKMMLLLVTSILSAYRILPFEEQDITSLIEFKDSLVRCDRALQNGTIPKIIFRRPMEFRCRFVSRH
jgi:hypothetical protein